MSTDAGFKTGLYALRDRKFGFFSPYIETNDEIAKISGIRYVCAFSVNFDRKDLGIYRLGYLFSKTGNLVEDLELVLDVGSIDDDAWKEIFNKFCEDWFGGKEDEKQ